MNTQRGFALLLELVMVMAVLAILALLAVPSYANHQSLLQAKQVLESLSKVRTDIATNALCGYGAPQSLDDLEQYNYAATNGTGTWVQTVCPQGVSTGGDSCPAGWEVNAGVLPPTGGCCPSGDMQVVGGDCGTGGRAYFLPTAYVGGTPTNPYVEQVTYGPLVHCLTLADGCAFNATPAPLGTLVAVFSSTALPPLRGKALVMTPTVQPGGGITWQCTIPGSSVIISPNC